MLVWLSDSLKHSDTDDFHSTFTLAIVFYSCQPFALLALFGDCLTKQSKYFFSNSINSCGLIQIL